MSFSLKLCLRGFILTAVFLVIAFTITAPSGWAQFYDLQVLVGDTMGLPGTQNSVISVFMRNDYDIVSAFELWMVLETPDIMEFQTKLDTLVVSTYYACTEYDGADCTTYVVASDYWVCTEWTGEVCTDSAYLLGYYECLADTGESHICIDSTFHAGFDSTGIDTVAAYSGNLDTAGTLVSGWELVTSRSLGGQGLDIKITASADAPPGNPPHPPGIDPQTGQIPLIKILGDIKNVPFDEEDREVKIMIQSASLNHFSFSDDNGDAIGIWTEELEDTLWWECETWADPPDNTVCARWKRVSEGPSDSFELDTLLIGHLDTSLVYLKDGSMTALIGQCGDADNDGNVNLSDILFLITNVYLEGPDPLNPLLADVNCDGLPGVNINLSDILWLISFLYVEPPGDDPCCEMF